MKIMREDSRICDIKHYRRTHYECCAFANQRGRRPYLQAALGASPLAWLDPYHRILIKTTVIILIPRLLLSGLPNLNNRLFQTFSPGGPPNASIGFLERQRPGENAFKLIHVSFLTDSSRVARGGIVGLLREITYLDFYLINFALTLKRNGFLLSFIYLYKLFALSSTAISAIPEVYHNLLGTFLYTMIYNLYGYP